MIDVKAISKAKKELNRLHGEIKETNQRISQLTKKAGACEQWAREKAQEAAEAPLRTHLGKIELAAYYVKAAGKARSEIEIWDQRHRDALAQLHIAAGNYDEVREGLPEDIDQRVEIMGKYDLEWLFSAEHWAIDPLKCSIETFEMLCDLQRRDNDVLWNHFCKDDYEWESEGLEEIPLQWQRDRLAHAEAFVWNCGIDSDWYPQCDFEELALETPVAEFQDRLWDFFDEAREEGDRLEKRAEPVVGIDFGNPTSHTFTIYEPDPKVLKLFFPEYSEGDQEEVWYNPEADDLAGEYEALERDRTEHVYYRPAKDWEAAIKSTQEATDRLNERLSPWLLRRKPSSYTDYTELTGVKKREGVTFEEVERWARENSAQIPGLNFSSEMDMEKLFQALFGREG